MNPLITYTAACTLATIVAIVIIRPSRIIDIRHFALLFIVVMYVTYVVRPVLAITIDGHLGVMEFYYEAISTREVMATLEEFAFVFGLALTSFAVAYRIVPRANFQQIKVGERDGLKPWQKDSAKFVAICMVLAGYASFLFAQRGFVGIAEVNQQFVRTAGGTGFANTTGYVELANYLVVSGTLLYYAISKRMARSLLMTVPWTINQVYYGYNRHILLVLLVGIFAVWLIQQREWLPRWQTALAPLLAIGVIGYVIMVRGDRLFLQRGNSVIDTVQRTSQQHVGDIMGDLAGFEGSWYMMTTNDRRVPKYGAGIVYQYVVKPIPRLLWPSKPYPLDFTWRSVFGLPEDPVNEIIRHSDSIWWTGPVKGSIGMAFDEWGLLGLPVTFAATGLFLAWMERRVMMSANSVLWVATYGATYGLITVLGRIDIFLAGLNHLLIFYLPYALILWWITKAPHAKRNARREQRIGSAQRITEPVGTD